MNLNRLKAFFEDYPAKLYFVALSGGVDSMTLLHCLIKLNLPLHILHVNYNLRGKESMGEESFIIKTAQKLDIPYTIKNTRLVEKIKIKGNLQATAREVRYNFFTTKLNQIPDSYVVTGHNLDDQIENFWIHLIRNSGRSGLSGMNKRNKKILRPLLEVERSQIETFAKQNSITWREDSSNKKNDYLRNVLRNIIIPQLNAEFPNLKESMQLIQSKLKLEEEVDMKSLDKYLSESEDNFKIQTLKLWSTEKLILFLKHYGLQGANLKPFNQFLSSSTGSQFVSPKGTFYMDRDHLYFEYKGTRRQTKYKINIEQVSELPEQFNKQELYIDQEKINGNIYSRNWKKGDRIFPMGMQGSKLVSDVLKDAKIPDFRKKEICIISDDDNILFIHNLVVDRRKAASIFSQKILKISVENH